MLADFGVARNTLTISGAPALSVVFLRRPKGSLPPCTASPATTTRKNAVRLIFVQAACLGAISRLDPDDLDELGLITRLQEIVEMVGADLDHLAHPKSKSR